MAMCANQFDPVHNILGQNNQAIKFLFFFFKLTLKEF